MIPDFQISIFTPSLNNFNALLRKFRFSFLLGFVSIQEPLTTTLAFYLLCSLFCFSDAIVMWSSGCAFSMLGFGLIGLFELFKLFNVYRPLN